MQNETQNTEDSHLFIATSHLLSYALAYHVHLNQ